MERFRNSPFTLALLTVNLAVFLLEEILRIFFDTSLFPFLALSRDGLMEGGWWQVVTHGFVHGNLLHLVVNMVGLWFTGPILEGLLGGMRYLILYFGGIIAGGLLQTLAGRGSVDLVGASGAVCALLVGFGTLLPRLQITALIFFVIPVRMKAATLGWLVVVSSFFLWILGIERGIGHLAHLGGGIFGFLICSAYKALGCINQRPTTTAPLQEIREIS